MNFELFLVKAGSFTAKTRDHYELEYKIKIKQYLQG
jgi:hypothetical protein